MTLAQRRLLFWSPRLLGITFAVFLSSFALDVFGEGYGFGRTILALAIHLIPTGIFLLALGLACRFEGVGAGLFAILALFLLLANAGRSRTASLGVALFLSGPLFLLAALFLANWVKRAALRERS